jgi:hypothetical protein
VNLGVTSIFEGIFVRNSVAKSEFSISKVAIGVIHASRGRTAIPVLSLLVLSGKYVKIQSNELSRYVHLQFTSAVI